LNITGFLNNIWINGQKENYFSPLSFFSGHAEGKYVIIRGER
jgi:hypothetical protein